jgi:uncharacterized protein (TIGR02145 family)
MKKFITLTLAIIFMATGITFANPTQDEGVVIGGTRWATRNVESAGAFVANIEDAGMFFQWNRRSSGFNISPTGEIRGWDTSLPTGNSWTRENDPCPAGWRVPTEAELQSLVEAGNFWATINGVEGAVFGTAPNQIFLPAAGWRNSAHNGNLYDADSAGYYWSSNHYGIANARALLFFSSNTFIGFGRRAHGYKVRCVRE